MSMYIAGHQPSNKRGDHFHVNNGAWAAVADFIVKHGPPEVTSECQDWYHVEDGHLGLGAASAVRLAMP